MKNFNNIAICCMSGGYKSVFTHGVLTAFEENNLAANVYTSCSSSTLITAFAAFKEIGKLDLTLWESGYKISQDDNGDQSQAMLQSIQRLSPEIMNNLWKPTSSRLLITTSHVKTDSAVAVTQSDTAKRFGQMLLLNALRHKSEWKDENLELVLFDTHLHPRTKQLTKDNFNDVAYATTRMLHAWKIPAFIDNQAYIDGSYTSYWPIDFLVKLKPERIVCICTEREKQFFNIFGNEEVPSQIDGICIDFIKPDFNLKDIGLDFYTISDDGLKNGYKHGYEKGLSYIGAV